MTPKTKKKAEKMQNSYTSVLEVFFKNRKLHNKFLEFLKTRIKGYFGFKKQYLRNDPDSKEEFSDQEKAVYECFDLIAMSLIIQQPCNWGKSFVDACMRIVLIEFYHNNRQEFRDLNGGKPLVFVITAPLTALGPGNQLEKDFPLLVWLHKTQGVNFQVIQNCSGGNSVEDNYDLFEEIQKDSEYSDDEMDEIEDLFDHNVRKCTRISMNTLKEYNNCDVILFYTCDKSLKKFIKYEEGYIDALSSDESHMDFLNGSDSTYKNGDEKEIFASLKKIIKKNPFTLYRYYTATPVYVEGCEKSTANESLFGKLRIYTNFHRMIELDRALPVECYRISYEDEKGKSIDNTEFENYPNARKGEVYANTIVKIPELYRTLNTGEKYCHPLIKLERQYFEYLYAMYKVVVDSKDWEVAKETLTFECKKTDMKEYDLWIKELDKGSMIICTTSKNGAIILSKDLQMEFDSVVDLVKYCKTKEFLDNYLNRDIYTFNIEQLSTGLDYKILNCTINFLGCSEASFVQFIMRAGRLTEDKNGNLIKKKNIVFLPDFALSEAHVVNFIHVLQKLEAEIGAFEGKVPVKYNPKKKKKANEIESIALVHTRELLCKVNEKYEKTRRETSDKDIVIEEWKKASKENEDEWYDALLNSEIDFEKWEIDKFNELISIKNRDEGRKYF